MTERLKEAKRIAMLMCTLLDLEDQLPRPVVPLLANVVGHLGREISEMLKESPDKVGRPTDALTKRMAEMGHPARDAILTEQDRLRQAMSNL